MGNVWKSFLFPRLKSEFAETTLCFLTSGHLCQHIICSTHWIKEILHGVNTSLYLETRFILEFLALPQGRDLRLIHTYGLRRLMNSTC